MTVPETRRLRPSAKSLFQLAVLALLIGGALIGLLVLQKGYGWHEMDWNGDGWTSPFELLEAIDSSRIDVVTPAGPCEQYLRYKDASVLALRCPTNAADPPPGETR